MVEGSWPLILLAMRVIVVAGLYLFVFVTVRALRAELRARTMPVAPAMPGVGALSGVRAGPDVGTLPYAIPLPSAPPRTIESVPAARVSAPPAELAEEAPMAGAAIAEPVEPSMPRAPRRPPPLRPGRSQRRPRATPWTVLGPLYVGLGVAAIAAALFALRPSTGVPEQAAPSANQATLAPAPGHVTVALAAQEPTNVRVTIDGTVQFEGMMRAGERRNWDGKSAIEVWTDKGKTLGLTVDGRDLGPYSPAMGHPDWSRIDYSFWPGWSQSLRR